MGIPGTFKNITNSCTVPRSCRERFLPLRDQEAAPLTERGVNFSGISELVPPYDIGRRQAPFHLVVFSLGGRAEFLTTNAERQVVHGEITAGDLWVVPAGCAHRYRAQGEWKMLFFHIDTGLPGSEITYEQPQLVRFRSAGQLESAMTWYCNEIMANTRESREIARSYAQVIRLCLDRELGWMEQPEKQETQVRLDALWEEIASSLGQNWSVDEMASRLHLSTAQFRRVVIHHHGRNPTEILQRMRIERTQQLLRQTKDSLDQIAERVGYESPFSLSRVFKRTVGMSPRDYRKSTYPKDA